MYFKVGDLVQVERDKDLPCDMILLFSSNENGTCHTKTANLDGETNLKVNIFSIYEINMDLFKFYLNFIQQKIRYIPYKFPRFTREEELFNLNGVISCEKPNTRLHEFKGTIEHNNNI
jgi:hypothetical protein